MITNDSSIVEGHDRAPALTREGLSSRNQVRPAVTFSNGTGTAAQMRGKLTEDSSRLTACANPNKVSVPSDRSEASKVSMLRDSRAGVAFSNDIGGVDKNTPLSVSTTGVTTGTLDQSQRESGEETARDNVIGLVRHTAEVKPEREGGAALTAEGSEKPGNSYPGPMSPISLSCLCWPDPKGKRERASGLPSGRTLAAAGTTFALDAERGSILALPVESRNLTNN